MPQKTVAPVDQSVSGSSAYSIIYVDKREMY